MLDAIQYRQGSFPKTCGCGEVYTQDAWQQLPFGGIWPGSDMHTGRKYGPDLETRNCTCGSTVAVPIEEVR